MEETPNISIGEMYKDLEDIKKWRRYMDRSIITIETNTNSENMTNNMKVAINDTMIPISNKIIELEGRMLMYENIQNKSDDNKTWLIRELVKPILTIIIALIIWGIIQKG